MCLLGSGFHTSTRKPLPLDLRIRLSVCVYGWGVGGGLGREAEQEREAGEGQQEELSFWSPQQDGADTVHLKAGSGRRSHWANLLRPSFLLSSSRLYPAVLKG